MENLWIVVGDELRMDKVQVHHTLIGENMDILKCWGSFDIDHNNKVIDFKCDGKICDETWKMCLLKIKKQGFYSPIIKNYIWNFSDNND